MKRQRRPQLAGSAKRLVVPQDLELNVTSGGDDCLSLLLRDYVPDDNARRDSHRETERSGHPKGPVGEPCMPRLRVAMLAHSQGTHGKIDCRCWPLESTLCKALRHLT